MREGLLLRKSSLLRFYKRVFGLILEQDDLFAKGELCNALLQHVFPC